MAKAKGEPPSQPIQPALSVPQKPTRAWVRAIQFLGGKIWRWDVTLYGSGAIVLAGGISSLFSDEYVLAAVSFFVALVWLATRSIADKEVQDHEHRGLVVGGILVIGAAVFGGSLLLIRYVEISKRGPAESLEGPTLEMGAFHEKVDSLQITVGGMTSSAPLSLFATGRVFPLSFGPDEHPITVATKGNKILVNAKLWGGVGLAPVEIEGNNFTVRTPPGWDRNSSNNAMEVVDPEGRVYFQMIRKTASQIAFYGVFPRPDGKLFLASPKGTLPEESTIPSDFKIDPLFKYPSWKYPGKYADGSN
jgi:hypothetical protein